MCLSGALCRRAPVGRLYYPYDPSGDGFPRGRVERPPGEDKKATLVSPKGLGTVRLYSGILFPRSSRGLLPMRPRHWRVKTLLISQEWTVRSPEEMLNTLGRGHAAFPRKTHMDGR